MQGIVFLNLFVFFMAVTMLCVVIKFYRLNKETPSYKYKFILIMFILAFLITLFACRIIDASFYIS